MEEEFEFKKLYVFRHIYEKVSDLKTMVLSLESLLESKIPDISKIPVNVPQDEFSQTSIRMYWLYKETFPRTFWKTVFIQAYFIIENNLEILCIMIESYKNLPIGPGDLKDRGVTRSVMYLKKVAGIKKPFENSNWSNFKSYNFIRNSIAHSDGNFRKNDEKHFELIEKFNNTLHYIDKDLSNELLLTKEFCLNFLNFIEINFKNIEAEYKF